MKPEEAVMFLQPFLITLGVGLGIVGSFAALCVVVSIFNPTLVRSTKDD